MLQFRAVTSLPIPSRHEEKIYCLPLFSSLSASRRLPGEEMSRTSDLLFLPIPPVLLQVSQLWFFQPFWQKAFFSAYKHFPVPTTGWAATQPGSLGWLAEAVAGEGLLSLFPTLTTVSWVALQPSSGSSLSCRWLGLVATQFWHGKPKHMKMELLKKRTSLALTTSTEIFIYLFFFSALLCFVNIFNELSFPPESSLLSICYFVSSDGL